MKIFVKLLFVLLFLMLFSLGVSAEDKITVVLDPGHGGHDPGTIVGTRYESEYINDLTPLLKEYLEETGDFEVIVTRGENEYLKYLPRALVAAEADADILISLHFNSGDTPYKNGVEVLASVLDEWYPETLSLAITASISKSCGLADSGVIRKADTGDARGIYYWHDGVQWDIPGVYSGRKSDYYSMISWGTKLGFPAIIVEHGYLSNAGDLRFCDSDGAMENLARAEADAIIEYYTGHTHTYGALTCDRVANCCLEGVFSRKCTVCGHRTDITRTPVNEDLHGWTEESQAASCTSDGFISRECQVSRNLNEKGLPQTKIHTYNEVLPAYGHNITVDYERVAAHGVDGYKKESCKNCGEVWEYYTAGDPHVYVSDGTVMTCSSTDPNVDFTCTVCGDVQRRTLEIPPHSFEVKDSVLPSCTEDGFEQLVCSVCSFEKTEVLFASGHDYGEKIVNIGCDFASDVITYTCAHCNDTVTETVEIPPHDKEFSESVPPSCESDGYDEYVCSACGAVIRDVIPALGHDYGEGETIREAGYFMQGEIRFVCKTDSSHFKTELTEKKDGGFLIILAAVAGAVAVAALIVLILMKGANKKLAETSETASAILEKAENEESKKTEESKESEEDLTV